jgi:hypothetical protein
METRIRILIIRLSGSSANALIIIRFNSENFFEFRYGLFFCENDNSISRINDAPSGRYHDTFFTDNDFDILNLWGFVIWFFHYSITPIL